MKSFKRNNRHTNSRKIFPALNVESIILSTIIVVYSLISSIHSTSIHISTERVEILELRIIYWCTVTATTAAAISSYLTTIEISVKIPKILKMSI